MPLHNPMPQCPSGLGVALPPFPTQPPPDRVPPPSSQVLQRALSSEEGGLPSCCQSVGLLYFVALDLLALLTSPPSHITADLHLPSLPDTLHALVRRWFRELV